MARSSSHLVAIGYALAGFTSWMICDACIKHAGQAGIPVHQIVALLSMVTVLVVVVVAWKRGRLQALRPCRVKAEIIRSLVQVGLAVASVVMFTHLPLMTAYAGVFTAPMVISLLAFVFLGERLHRNQVLAIFAGFMGVLIALGRFWDSSQNLPGIGYLAMLVDVLFFSISMLLVRVMSRSETDESMVVFPALVRIAVFMPFCFWHSVPMTWEQVAWLVGGGGIATLGWLAMNMAYRRAPAATVAPMHYSQILTGAAVGYVVWGDVPSWNLILGIGIIVAAGLFLARHASRPVAAAVEGPSTELF